MNERVFAEAKNEVGDTLVQFIGAPNGETSDNWLSNALYVLSELLLRTICSDQSAYGFLGGRYGYGATFENNVFVMAPDCQDCSCPRKPYINEAGEYWVDEYDHQPACESDRPCFRHKASGVQVDWYKWIGRDMTVSPEGVSAQALANALRECFKSIPEEHRIEAARQAAYEK